MSDMFNIKQVRTDGAVAVLQLNGRFGADSAQGFKDYCHKLREGGVRHLIVDLSRVTFVASIGAGTLMITTQVFARDGGSMQVVALSEPVARVVNLLNLDRFLKIQASEEAALEWLAAKQD